MIRTRQCLSKHKNRVLRKSDADRSSDAENERSSMTYEQLAERRSTPRSKTPFYKVMLGLNIVGWVGMVVVLILFHYARPDFISGVQQYWGIKAIPVGLKVIYRP